MANGRSGSKPSKKNPVAVRGAWLPMPLKFLRTRACASLSPQASKMLLDMCMQLGPNAANNGSLSTSAGGG